MTVLQGTEVKTLSGGNYSVVHAGPLSELNKFELEMPNRKVHGKLFVKQALAATGMQVSMNKFPANYSMPFSHQHKQNEEVYVFVKGRGQMQIDGDIVDVEEGTMVRIAPNGLRAWRNHSNEDLYFICIQAKANSLEQDTVGDGIKSDEAVKW